MSSVNRVFGILLCFLIALPAWFFGRAFPLVGGPVTAILAGIVISLIFPNLLKTLIAKKFSFGDGVKFTSKKLLQYSIVLLGFEMNLFNVLSVGRMSLTVMCFTFLAVFVTVFCVGRLLKLPANTTVLIGVGTSICGGSAIAAVAPVIRAEDDDVTRAISTIFLFNIIAIFVFPVLGKLMGMTDTVFGIWAGTAVNDTSSVVAAGTAWSNAVGNDIALNTATIVKLTRTLMIVPITLVLAFYTTRKMKNDDEAGFRFTKVFPWFVLFFIAAAMAKTFLNIPAEITSFLVQIGKFIIIMAMAAIGLNTNLKGIFSHGIKPLVLGLLCWLAIGIVSISVLHFTAL